MQHNDIGTKKDLALYRIETAKSDMKSAKILAGAKLNRNIRKAYGTNMFHRLFLSNNVGIDNFNIKLRT